MDMSMRRFIELVNRAYPEVVEKPIVTDEQQMLLWQVFRVIDKHPEIVEAKSVRHNLGRAKLAWVRGLVEQRKAQVGQHDY